MKRSTDSKQPTHTMISLFRTALLSLTLVPCALAQEPSPQTLPPVPILEAKLETVQEELGDATRELRGVQEDISELDDEIEEAEDEISAFEDKIDEYRDLLAEHESNAADPYLHPMQRAELARAMRATRAHIQKLGSVMRGLQQDRSRAQQKRAECAGRHAALVGRVREIQAVIRMIEKDLTRARGRG